MSVAGHAPLDLPFTASITEVIGTVPVAGANPPQSVPAVIRKDQTLTSVPFISWIIPLFNFYAGSMSSSALAPGRRIRVD